MEDGKMNVWAIDPIIVSIFQLQNHECESHGGVCKICLRVKENMEELLQSGLTW